jgi:hypothetical protein
MHTPYSDIKEDMEFPKVLVVKQNPGKLSKPGN